MRLHKRLTVALVSAMIVTSSVATMAEVTNQKVVNSAAKETETEEVIMLASFEDGIPDYVNSVDTELEVVTTGATDGSKALKVSYAEADFPAVKFTPEKPWNFGKNKALAFDVYNPTKNLATLYVRMDVKDPVTGEIKQTVNTTTVQPGEQASMFASYSKDSLDLGMRGLPPHPAGKNLGYGWGETSLELNNVVEVQFWMMYNKTPIDLIFDNVRIINDPNVDISYINDTVDAYGQYTGLDWAGKIKTDEDLVAHRKAEENEYASGRPEYMSQYGGWAKGPQLEATGRFRTEMYDGKWTLVDPDGYLFFATGVDCVRFGDASTWIDGRNQMFKDLPSKDGELAEHFGHAAGVARPPLGLAEGTTFNFYTANLERKYGEDYVNAWRDMTVARFKSWGFSSVGNWSEPELFFGKGEDLKITYTANAWINGSHAMLKSGNEFAPEIADPFDPEFRVSAKKAFDEVAAYGVDDDKWCMGIYVDNEIAWGNPNELKTHYGSILYTLEDDAAAPASHAKRAFIEKLKEIHKNDIKSLNSKWGTAIASWEELSKPYTVATLSDGVVEDLSTLLNFTADKYYSVVDEELEKALPNTLNLGSRFAEWGTSIEVQKACAKYADIVSFNVYKDDIHQNWIYTEEINKPCIVGEFHFGATDRGMFSGGLVSAIDQEDRGDKYTHYMREVANNEYFVGAHWFQYMDQPLTGRAWDGENYNCGFIDGTDTPYKELVDAAKAVHEDVYDIRFDSTKVEGVKLDKNELSLTPEANTETLKATISPADATFKDVIWSSSNERVASVDKNGKVTGLSNGEATITVVSKANPSIKAECKVTVAGYEEIICDFEDIDFKSYKDFTEVSSFVYGTEDMTMDLNPEKGLVIKTAYDSNWGGADAFAKPVQINQEGTWSFGGNPTVKAKLSNPSDKELSMGMNIQDSAGKQRQTYFKIPAGETIEVEYADWTSTFKLGEIDFLTFYIIEEGSTAITNDTFIVESISVEDESKGENPDPEEPDTEEPEIVPSNFEKITFSDLVNQEIPFLSYEQGMEVRALGVGEKNEGLYVRTVESQDLKGYYKPLIINKEGTWNFGTKPVFKAVVHNPLEEDLTLGINMGKDDWTGNTDFTFEIKAGEVKELIIDDFKGLDLEDVGYITMYPIDIASPNPNKTFVVKTLEVTNGEEVEKPEVEEPEVPGTSENTFKKITFSSLVNQAIPFISSEQGMEVRALGVGEKNEGLYVRTVESQNAKGYYKPLIINEEGTWNFGVKPVFKAVVHNPLEEDLTLGMNMGKDDWTGNTEFKFEIKAGEVKELIIDDFKGLDLENVGYITMYPIDVESPNPNKTFVVKTIEVLNQK